jgi:hypothetical protein
LTDENGNARIIVAANAPEAEELDIKVSKDTYNYCSQVLKLGVGTVWLIVGAILAVLVIGSLICLRKRRKRIID